MSEVQESIPDINTVIAFFKTLQDNICSGLANADGEKTFIEDNWQREQGGGGRTRVLTNGAIFEQAGVNFSHVFGENLPPSATATPTIAQSWARRLNFW